MPSSTTFAGLKTLIAALRDPEDLWKLVEQAIDLIPTERKDPNQNESIQIRVTTTKKRKILFNFVHKALELMPTPPNYTSVEKRKKRKYAYLYQLVDKILPFAAGSSSRTEQLELLKTRWKHMHKETLTPAQDSTHLTLKTLKDSIGKLPDLKK